MLSPTLNHFLFHLREDVSPRVVGFFTLLLFFKVSHCSPINWFSCYLWDIFFLHTAFYSELFIFSQVFSLASSFESRTRGTNWHTLKINTHSTRRFAYLPPSHWFGLGQCLLFVSDKPGMMKYSRAGFLLYGPNPTVVLSTCVLFSPLLRKNMDVLYSQKPSMLILFAFEFAILALQACSTFSRSINNKAFFSDSFPLTNLVCVLDFLTVCQRPDTCFILLMLKSMEDGTPSTPSCFS